MPGRIREDDIAEVREKTRIEEVIGEYVTLRNAGGGSLKGLCPFHDEKTPSFNVNPSRQFFHCFGCQEGGDVLTFLMKIDGLSFTESVERLAEKTGIRLRREDGDIRDDRPKGPPRQRLIEANRAAQEFYAEHLAQPDAATGRQFLLDRGFDADSAEHFGIGFAPRGGEDLLKHLRGRGYSQDELVAAGLVAVGRSAYDRFRGRLLWPIRDASGATIGFGARRLFDDDRIEAKYLNTPETSLYKKSQVLYGIDLARQAIGKASQAVVVEGYTDVMACHLAGVTTAVASCGTAFGDEHTRVLRRFLHDHEEFRGEVIFTFDGDAAGQAAALKAFAGDQKFVSQTYVAVQPDGIDPCDLRIRDGDAAVRDLVASRTPLYRFVLGNIVRKYDLDRADGRIDAVRESARLVASVRDQSKVTAFAQEISRMIGADVDTNVVLSEVRRAAGRGGHEPAPGPGSGAPLGGARPAAPALRDRAGDAQAGAPAPDGHRSHHRRHRQRRLHPPDSARGVGAGRGGRGSGGRVERPELGVAAARQGARPVGVGRAERARGGAAEEGAGRRLRDALRGEAARAHHVAPDRRGEDPAAAHEPGRAGRRLQQDVRRARRARAASPYPARPDRRRLVSAT